jgi:hypothetical protein
LPAQLVLVYCCHNGCTGRCSTLQEYDDDDSEPVPKKVTKYIEAISGAQFAVRYEFKSSFRAEKGVIAQIHLDGKWISATAFKACEAVGRHVISNTSERVRNEYYRRPFSFSQLSIGKRLKEF